MTHREVNTRMVIGCDVIQCKRFVDLPALTANMADTAALSTGWSSDDSMGIHVDFCPDHAKQAEAGERVIVLFDPTEAPLRPMDQAKLVAQRENDPPLGIIAVNVEERIFLYERLGRVGPSVVYRCASVCGATVDVEALEMHAVWHGKESTR